MSRLPTLKPHQVVRALERAGFEIDHQTGSHVVMRRARDGCRVVVPWHNRDLGRGLTLQIIKSAGLTRDEFVELLKQLVPPLCFTTAQARVPLISHNPLTAPTRRERAQAPHKLSARFVFLSCVSWSKPQTA